MVEAFWKEKLRAMPSTPGVYLMRDAAGRIIYIGKAINLKRRVSSYFRPDREEKAAAIVHSLRHIDYLLCASEREALILERQLINEFQPYFNSMWRDDKSYPYLKLTLKEDFPRLLLTRKIARDGSEYFGPYPQVVQIKRLMRWMQKMFKWRPCRLDFDAEHLPREQTVKSCLYYHTEQCAGPCMGKITPREARKVAGEIRLFLKGRYKRLENIWQEEMKEASARMEYEKAADIRDRLEAIRSMQERVTVRELKPEDLAASIQVTRTLEELKQALGLSKWPIVIEGFDISTISGTESVGSMVRFHNARPDKDNYRKFRIRTVGGIDDFAMMKEVVFRRYRRLKEESREMPDLVLIDGGKGQLSSALESLRNLGVKLPVVSLAKREEEIFMPGNPAPLKLPANSPALHLLQNIRDEAHRFALSYHHVRRKNNMGLHRR
ncbi:MAG: excinuclease ABC subunit UvrC [Endomicrobiales bacterium]